MNLSQPPASAEDYRRSLKRLTDELLCAQADDGRLRAAAAELYGLCASVTGIDEGSTEPCDLDATQLARGLALSPKDAARCVLDYSRTAKFLRGAQAAILEAQKRFPRTPVEILYAGCGPFAPLALPLTSRFASHEIQFTLLDIHKRSLEAAQQLFQAFGLAAFVRDYIECDAAVYQHRAEHAIHLVLMEAMQTALEKEPQVGLMMNLAPQLNPGAIFIPERITVDAYLCDFEKEVAIAARAQETDSLPDSSALDACRTYLGRVFELVPENCRSPRPAESRSARRDETHLPAVVLEGPVQVEGEPNLMLLTTVNVFDTITLSGYESGITIPVILCSLGKIPNGARIEFVYALGESPGFKCRVL